MIRKKIIFTICFILFYISNLSAELNYKKVGQWDLKMGRANFAMTSGSWWVDVMQGGTLSLGQDKGEIHTCIEDGYTYNEPKNLIWVELECSITMPDKSKIYLEYSSKLLSTEIPFAFNFFGPFSIFNLFSHSPSMPIVMGVVVSATYFINAFE